MQLEYGEVKQFDPDKGFGFVSRLDWANNRYHSKNIFFHVSMIRAKNRERANELTKTPYADFDFWYTIEDTKKGKQVKELWFAPSDIPAPLREALFIRLKPYWENPQKTTPKWLNAATEALVGKVRGDELRRQRASEIQKRQAAAATLDRLKEQERENAETKKKQVLERIQDILRHQRAEEIRKVSRERQITTLFHFTRVSNLLW